MLLFIRLFSSYAQNTDYIFSHITTNEGLVNNRVTSIHQDREGFMWIGTQSGLQRYDGIRFKNYPADVRDTAALQSDWISAIFEDSKNRLWIGNDNGTAYTLNRNTGKFYNYNLHAATKNKTGPIWDFAEDKNGMIIIMASSGFYRLNESTNQFEKYGAYLGLDQYTLPGFLDIDDNNNFWIGTNAGIKFYNQQEKKLYDETYNPLHNPVFDIKEPIGKMILQGNYLWVSCDRLLYQYNFSTNKMKTFSFKHLLTSKPESKLITGKIGGAFKIQDGGFIVLLPETGLAVYQPASDDFFFIDADNSKSYAYHINENIESSAFVLQDKEKNILIGTNSGINIFNPDKQVFQTHWPGARKSKRFPKESAVDFLQLPEGDILIAYYNTNGGIVKMNSAFQFKKQYLLSSNGNKNSASNQVWGLYKDERGMIWAPNQNKAILKLNLQTDQLTEENDPEIGSLILVMKRDMEGDTWLGYWGNGLGQVKAGTHKMQAFKQFLFSDSTNIKRVQCILPEGNKVWAGTFQNGLQVFDKKKEKFVEAFVNDEKNNSSISNNNVTDILRYSKDTLVLATLMGINIFDEKNKSFKTITAKEGLPNNLVQSLIKDNAGNVWAACYDDGFCKINMTDFTVTNYGAGDGLTDNTFTSKFYRLNDGKFLIGASGSFVSFNPDLFKTSPPPADVRIISVHIFENELPMDSLLQNKLPLTLSYKNNSIKIEFASLKFWNPGSIKYFYKLTGIDKDWIPADKNAVAIYNQLKEGHYVFNVGCKNRDGVFCINTTQLKIIIEPPFWKTWWFTSFVIVCFAALIYVSVKWREKGIKAIAAEKLKVQQLNADQYKNKLELEKIINYFSSSLADKHTIEAVLWDVAKNLIGHLGFIDCMFYLWNEDKTNMLQKAGFGQKDTAEEINRQPFTVLPGQGVVGYVVQTRESVLIKDTSADSRYRPDDFVRLSELAVPIIYDDELLGVLDSEHTEKDFFTARHLQILTTIATLVANKIKSIEAEQLLQQKHVEIYSINEQLSKAKLEALRSQMNPHFIFNSLNAIQECILTNKVDAAYKYLSHFSKLQRMVLNNSEKELIPLSSEIEMLQLYLSLESLRFSKSFIYTINFSGVTDTNEIMMPSLLTQPLVENAIWHGLRNKDGDKTLQIIYEERNGAIFITIDDNGIGRDAAAAIKKQKLGGEQFASKGTTILQQRLQVLGQQLKATIQLAITDKTDAAGNATGTKAVISFPADLTTRAD